MRRENNTAGGNFNDGLIRIADRMSKIAVMTMIAAAILFGSFMAVKSYSDSAVKNYIPKADQFLAGGEYQKAADLYSKYLKKYPENKTAMLGYIEAAIGADKSEARESALALLDSGILSAADYPHFIELCERIGDHGLSVNAYSHWMRISPGYTGAMMELAKAYISEGAFDSAIDIINSLSETGNPEAAAVLLGVASEQAKILQAPAGDIIRLCEMWYGADETNLDALLSLADAYAGGGMEAEAEDCYRRALETDIRNGEIYDGLLSLLYKNERLRDRYDLLEAAIRNAGGKKYRDMLDTARIKLAEYYSIVHEDGITYRDGIFRIIRLDPDGNAILAGASDIFGPDETSYLIEYYDNLGNAKEMLLDCAKIQTQIGDIDGDGIREVLIKRYITADGMSVEAMKNVFWYDVFRIDRELNKLIYSTPEYKNYYRTTYAQDLSRKLSRFERLSEALEGHYGVVYGILYALRTAALDFANDEWTPDGTGADLRGRICRTLIVPELEQYVADKTTMYGFKDNDIQISAADMTYNDSADIGIYPGMSEADLAELLGPPRYVTEEEMKAVRPDGEAATYINRIVEYAGLNFYVSDGIVKALRVNSRDYEGPRALRIGDTTRDIVNKFPAAYFDDIANFIMANTDSDIEFMDTERGIVLNYSVTNGIVMSIELYFRDSSGDWKPGTNIETILPPGGSGIVDAAASAESGDGATAADGAAESAESVDGVAAADGAADATAGAANSESEGATAGEAANGDATTGENLPSADNATAGEGIQSTGDAVDAGVLPSTEYGTDNVPEAANMDTAANTYTDTIAGTYTDTAAEATADTVTETAADNVADINNDTVAETGADIIADTATDNIAGTNTDTVAEATTDTTAGTGAETTAETNADTISADPTVQPAADNAAQDDTNATDEQSVAGPRQAPIAVG